MAEIQRQQADVQQMQAKHLAQHEQRMSEQDEGIRLHEQRMREQDESMRLHQQRMNHVDMRLAEITDKLDGLIGFMGGYFKGPN